MTASTSPSTPPTPWSASPLRASLWVIAAYLAVAVVITWPLATDLSGQLIGHDTSDAYEMGHHIWWFKHALQTGEPLFYQTLLAYPDGIQGISLWSNPLQFFPAWALAFIMPVAAAYNLTILLTMALNGWAMWWLARSLTPASATAPLFAGLIFTAFPTFQGHLFGGHAGLLVMWPVPLLVWALSRLVEAPPDSLGRRNWRGFATAVLLFVLSPFGHTLQVIYVLLLLMGLFLLARLTRRDWRGAGYVIGVGLLGGALLLIFLIPVIQDTFATEAYAGEGFVEYSMDLLGIVTPSFLHPTLGNFDYTRRVLGVNLIEGYAYIGGLAATLVIIAVATTRAARWWLLLAVAAWLLALGPLVKLYDTPVTLRIAEVETYLALPWAWIYDLPGFSLARTPGRFTFALALAVAAMAGYGLAAVERWMMARGVGHRARGSLMLGMAAFALWEYQLAWPYPTLPAAVPTAVRDLAARDDVRAVMDLPWGNLLAAKDGLYLQIWHQKPLIAGQVTRRTPVSPAKLTLLETTLDPALLRSQGVDLLILHKTRDDGDLEARLRAAFGAPSYEDDRLALYEVPFTEAAPTTTLLHPESRRFGDRAASYLYASAPGWYDFAGTLTAENRAIDLSVDGVWVNGWTIDGITPITAPLYFDAPGFITLALTLDPPCPRQVHPALACRSARFAPGDFDPAPRPSRVDADITLDDGITLRAASFPDRQPAGETLVIDLAWRFDAPRSADDVRFVHVLDAAGDQVAGHDSAPGARAAGDQLHERVTLDTSALPPGDYTLYAGWYRYPDLARYTVNADTPRAADGLIHLGALTLD